jgi:hypothetical protein
MHVFSQRLIAGWKKLLIISRVYTFIYFLIKQIQQINPYNMLIYKKAKSFWSRRYVVVIIFCLHGLNLIKELIYCAFASDVNLIYTCGGIINLETSNVIVSKANSICKF